MFSNIKQRLTDKMEELTTDIIMETGSVLMWGEIEIPECLYVESQKNEDD